MKNHKPYFYIVLFLFLGCDKYLDEVPDNRLEVGNLKNISELLVSAYPNASPLFLEFKTDNVAAIPGNTQEIHLTRNYQYKPVLAVGQMTPNYFWNETYAAIAHSNQALEDLDKVLNTNDEFKKSIRGEALITRAYNHFMLANTFCQHYEDGTASSLLGIPYVTSPEKELLTTYSRGTLQETYDKIEKDLLEALPLISDKFYKGTGKYHFNTKASLAFASRFYLFKGDWEKCIEYSNKLLGEGVPSPSNFRNMKVMYTGTRSNLMAINYYNVNHAFNLMVGRHDIGVGLRISYGYHYSHSKLNEIFFSGLNIQKLKDERDQRWGHANLGTFAPPKLTELFKYVTATTGYPYYIAVHFRSEEVVLNRMEAYIRTNKLDKALADYNAYAPSRFNGGGTLTKDEVHQFFKKPTEQESLLELAITERRKEFIREYLRWFDIKRLKLEVTHIDVQKNKFVLKKDDLRKAVQIPPSAIAQGIKPNPR